MTRRTSAFEPRWLITITFFVAGIFMGGLGLYVWLGTTPASAFKIHPADSKFKFINPLLAVDLNQNKQFSQNQTLELELTNLINGAKKSGVSNASVYYRDIEPGFWVSMNDGASFSPGRLLKIPIMISYYKLAESNPSILEKELTFQGPSVGKDIFGFPKEQLVYGQSYTVEELINRMIVNYDTDAANLLFDNIDKDSLNEIFSDLGIQFKEDKSTEDYIPLKTYSLFFRVLYNSSYLTREYSEKAIELLDKTDTDLGLGSNLPKNIHFGNRFGGRKLKDGKSEIYDCGIVYYPEHPYLICATAQGKDLQSLENLFTNIGLKVYEETAYRYPASKQ